MPSRTSLEDWIQSIDAYVHALQLGGYSHAWLRGPVHETLYGALGLVQRQDHYYSDNIDAPLRMPPYIDDRMVWIDLPIKAWPLLHQAMVLHPEETSLWFEGLYDNTDENSPSMV